MKPRPVSAGILTVLIFGLTAAQKCPKMGFCPRKMANPFGVKKGPSIVIRSCNETKCGPDTMCCEGACGQAYCIQASGTNKAGRQVLNITCPIVESVPSPKPCDDQCVLCCSDENGKKYCHPVIKGLKPHFGSVSLTAIKFLTEAIRGRLSSIRGINRQQSPGNGVPKGDLQGGLPTPLSTGQQLPGEHNPENTASENPVSGVEQDTTGAGVQLSTASGGEPPISGEGSNSPLGGSSSPLESSDSPLESSGSRLESSGSPLEESNSPHGSSDSPLEGADSPHKGSDNPLAGSESHLEGSVSPLAGSESPREGTDNPLAGSESPLEGSNSPLEVSTPAGSQLATSSSTGSPLEDLAPRRSV